MKNSLTFIACTILNICLIQAQEVIKTTDSFKSKPIIKMTLNGKEVWMLLDTGSSVNLLNESARRKYGFKVYSQFNPRNNVVGFASDAVSLQYAGKVDLRYKGIELKGDFLAHDLTNIADSFQHESGLIISGIIGSKMMQRYGFVIDMGNHTASINYQKRKRRSSKSCKLKELP